MLPLPPGFDSPEHFLSAVIDSSDDAIITKDLNGIVTSWNKGAERIFGYTAKEMVGRPILILIPPDRHDEEPMILDRLRRGERVDHIETRRVTKDGKSVEISLTISPVKNKAGEIVGASKVARDINLQKQAESAIAASNEEILRQSRMKDEFLTTLSHELRTPLQSIVGWVQILSAGELLPGELEQGLEVIGRNAKSQQHIIEDLLDVNRILSGKLRLEVHKIELSNVLEASLDTVRPAAEAKGVRLRSLLDSASSPVAGDPQRLQQVFWNLLINAIKFTPRGGSIEVSLQRVDSHIEVSLTDTGVGISGEFLPYVFDRFRQGDASTTRTQGGLGLGLALVKQIVELHGGSVMAKSPGMGMGSTFAVSLPLAAVKHAGEEPLGRGVGGNEAGNRGVPQLTGVHVLVVDDDPDSRTLVARTLEKSGARVRVAGSAEEAFRSIEDELPDVLVSDVGMPEKDGYTLMEELRAKPPEKGGRIPAAALTAYTRVEDRVQALCAGFQILLPKPVDALELIATVGSLARRAK